MHVFHRSPVHALEAARHGHLAGRALGASQRRTQERKREHDGHDEQQGEPPIDKEHRHDGEQRHGDGTHGVREVVADERLDHLDVVHQHLFELPLPYAAKPAARHASQLAHERRTHLEQHVKGRAMGEHEGEVGKQGAHDSRHDSRKCAGPHERGVHGRRVVPMGNELTHKGVYGKGGHQAYERRGDRRKARPHEHARPPRRKLQQARKTALSRRLLALPLRHALRYGARGVHRHGMRVVFRLRLRVDGLERRPELPFRHVLPSVK